MTQSPIVLALRRFRERPAAVLGLALIVLFVAVAVAAPLVAPFDPIATSWTAIRKAPSLQHWMGTDENGRDVLSRVVFGARASLLAGVVSVLIAALVLLALAAPLVSPYDPIATSWSAIRKAPSWQHPMGTDENGRDVLSRVVFGARASLLAGVVSVLLAAGVGVPMGLLAGFAGGRVDAVFNRDYPVVQGVVLVTACLYILLNLLADVLYVVINPRLRGA